MESAANCQLENPMKSRVLEYVTGFVDQNGFAPTYREIGRAVIIYAGLPFANLKHPHFVTSIYDRKQGHL